MVDQGTPASTGVRAADSVLAHTIKAIEVDDIEARVAELEASCGIRESGQVRRGIREWSQLLRPLKELEPNVVDQSGFSLTPRDGESTGLIRRKIHKR